MAQIYKIDSLAGSRHLSGCSCAFGVFDGIHVGHLFLLDATRHTAAQEGTRSAVLTFDIDPDELFCPESLKKLQSNEERIEMLAHCGLDAVVVLPFSRDMANMTASCFVEQLFEGNVPSQLHVGRDLRFGSNGSGTVEDLQSYGIGMGLQVHAYDLVHMDGAPITATRIRSLLAQGNIRSANKLLGRNYMLSGTVEAGRGEGLSLGFATANLAVAPSLLCLADGVYAGYALVGNKRYRAAVSVGVSPVFAETARANVEVHVLDFNQDVYGQRISVEFVEWLRPLVKFADVDELKQTVLSNIAWVRDNIAL